jgi:hypothetical protein
VFADHLTDPVQDILCKVFGLLLVGLLVGLHLNIEGSMHMLNGMV